MLRAKSCRNCHKALGTSRPCYRSQRLLPCPLLQPTSPAFTALLSLCSGLFLIRSLWGPHPVINLGLTSISILCRPNVAGCSFLLVGPDTIGFSTEINGLIAKAPFGAIRRSIVFPQPTVRPSGLAKLHFRKARKTIL